MKIDYIVLAALVAVSAFPVSAQIPAEDPGFVPFRCPTEKIRDAYSNLVDAEDTLVALAIEKQTLAICRQSQEALLRIVENENRLSELFEAIMTRDEDKSRSAVPVITRPTDPSTMPAAPSLPREPEADFEPEAREEPAEDISFPDPGKFAIPDSDDLLASIAPSPEERSAPATPPPYAVAAVMKDPLGWKAMLVDESSIFTVRPGDIMDGEIRVGTIERGRVELIDASGNVFTLE